MSRETRYWHDEVGYNYRLTNLQAAIGCAQLERIGEFIHQRKQLEEAYKSILNNHFKITWQKDLPDRNRVTWLVSFRSEEKNEIARIFSENEINCRPFFYPLSSMPIYKKFVFKPCKTSYEISRTGLSLPTFLGLDFDRIQNCFI